MTKFWPQLTVFAALAIASSAHAQTAPGVPPAPGIPSGAVSNSPTSSPGIAPVDADNTAPTPGAMAASTDAGALPSTGGEPWLMALSGLAIAGGAAMLRRKVA